MEKGTFGGEMEKDFRIKKEFLKKLKPEKFAKIIFLYQKIKPEISLYLHGGWWFERDFEYHQRNFLEKFVNSSLNKNLISKKEINLAQKIITENKKFLDSSAMFLCHGDLYPNNLILNEEGNLIILDWGLSTFNNFAFDVAFIYLMAHTIPQWQEKFLKKFLELIKERGEFMALFRIDLISLANRFAAQCYYLKLKERFERKTFLIFKNYLEFLKKAIYQKI
jgi:thiamine kinase-like enzyme